MTPVDQLHRVEKKKIPLLENGDHLTRDEFERRYEAMPENVKAELIEGVVLMPSPTKREHGAPDNLVNTWLGTYASRTPGTEADANATLRLDEFSEPQPDGLLRILQEAGGLARVDDQGYLRGPVELVAEVAASSVSYDLHEKKKTYLRHGVREYVVLLVRDRRVVWFALEAGNYVPLAPDRQGVIRSRVFAGLWLDTRALVAGDGAKVLKVLDRGLASKAHAAFARELGRKLRAGRRKKR